MGPGKDGAAAATIAAALAGGITFPRAGFHAAPESAHQRSVLFSFFLGDASGREQPRKGNPSHSCGRWRTACSWLGSRCISHGRPSAERPGKGGARGRNPQGAALRLGGAAASSPARFNMMPGESRVRLSKSDLDVGGSPACTSCSPGDCRRAASEAAAAGAPSAGRPDRCAGRRSTARFSRFAGFSCRFSAGRQARPSGRSGKWSSCQKNHFRSTPCFGARQSMSASLRFAQCGPRGPGCRRIGKRFRNSSSEWSLYGELRAAFSAAREFADFEAPTAGQHFNVLR